MLSLLYIVSYLGLGVPAVVAGFVIVHGGGLTGTALFYGGAVILLAALALPGLLRGRDRVSRRPPRADKLDRAV